MHKKGYLILGFVLMIAVFYVLANISFAAADDDNNSNSGSGSNRESSSGSGGSDNDDEDEDDDRDGDRNRTEIRITERDGEVEREFKTEIRTASGERIKIERKIRVKDGEVEIRTKLKVEGNGSNFSIVDSDGERHRVRVTPEKLKMLIIERLQAGNITDFSIDEVEHKNIPRVVFKVNSDHPGRFLGIFKLTVKADTQIDPETGEILDFNTPWWIFLVVGDDIPDSDEIVGNETLEDEIIASDEELEEEFEDIEVDEGLEIKAETFNGTSEVEIELEFNTDSTEQEQIVNEILNTLSNLNISFLLEIEESDEPLKDKDELEVEIESEDDLKEVEFELKFVVNSDSREDIINAITTRLSSLTAEDINNALALEDDEEEDEEEEENETEVEENETNSSS